MGHSAPYAARSRHEATTSGFARLGIVGPGKCGAPGYAGRRSDCDSLQHIVASLRAFLRHQFTQGCLRQALHERIDMPRTYRLERLPRALPWNQVVALLRSIDQATPGGCRDFTLLYLAACYGLRSGELVRLTLDDIDWRAGTLKVVQTKTKQALLLPLTDEAGQVLVRYLQTGRPGSAHREVFLRRRAPAGPLAPTAVHDILEHRIALSGMDLPPIGSHVLRHSLAVDLLRRGVSLPTIGAALGHRDVESTAVSLAKRWPMVSVCPCCVRSRSRRQQARS